MKTHEYKDLLNSISKNAETLAADIHKAGMYALQQANVYNNMAAGIDLVKAVGHKHSAERVKAWLIMFGKFKIKNGELLSSSKKQLSEDWQELADNTPYWKLNKEGVPKPVVIDYMKAVESLLNRAEKLADNEKEFSEVNLEFKEKLQALFITSL